MSDEINFVDKECHSRSNDPVLWNYILNDSIVKERFLSKVPDRSQDECWEWLGKARSHFGYGSLGLTCKALGIRTGVPAHRVSWALANGKQPKLLILHKCDNPPCVNPNHLYEGDQKQNVADMYQRGRDRHYVPGGSLSPHKVLTYDQVLEIRRLKAEKTPVPSLMRKFGVTRRTIYDIVNFHTWKIDESQLCR